MIDRTIQEFAHRLGLGRLRNGGMPPLSFRLEGLGDLSFSKAGAGPDEELVMSLALPLAPYDEESLPRALRLCHPDKRRAFALQAGLAGGKLILAVRAGSRGLSPALLENQAMFLAGIARELAQGK
jgi:type III secretion system chaperone SycN